MLYAHDVEHYFVTVEFAGDFNILFRLPFESAELTSLSAYMFLIGGTLASDSYMTHLFRKLRQSMVILYSRSLLATGSYRSAYRWSEHAYGITQHFEVHFNLSL